VPGQRRAFRPPVPDLPMSSVGLLVFLVIYVALQVWVLPRFGVST
jgi:hypothetical protein